MRGQKTIPLSTRRQLARLLQLHHETHPARLAARLGLSAGYVRRLWTETEIREMATLSQALSLLDFPVPNILNEVSHETVCQEA